MTSGAAGFAACRELPAQKFLFTVIVWALYNVIVPHISLPRFSSGGYEFLRHDLTFRMRLDADIIYNESVLNSGKGVNRQMRGKSHPQHSQHPKQFRGGEKKVMKKSLSLLLAIAMVFSMFATVAAAASADTQAKYDELKAAGVFVGRDGGDAALDSELTRAEFAGIIARLTGVTSGSPASFTDVPGTHWATKDIAAVTEAGFMQGTGNNKFEPSRNVTLQEVIAVAVRILGLEVDEDATVEGNAGAWAQPYIAAAIAAGLIQPLADYTANATRGDLVDVTYEVYQVIQNIAKVTGVEVVNSKKVVVTFSDGGEVEVELDEALQPGKNTITVTYNDREYSVDVQYDAPAVSAKIVGAKKIEVAFNQAVDTSKVTFSIKRGSNSVTIANTSWSDDKRTATIELASKFIAGEHEITVDGLDEKLTVKVTAETERVAGIEILNDVVPITDGTDAGSEPGDALDVAYKVVNQYGEDITSITSVTGTSTGGEVTPSNGSAKIQAPANTNFTLDSSVVLTLIHASSNTIVTKTLKVGAEAKAAQVVIERLYHEKDATLTTDSTIGEFYLVVNVKDQYGNTITDLTKLHNEVIVSITNPNIASVAGYANNKATFSKLTIDDKERTVLQLDRTGATAQAGTSVVTLIAAGAVGGNSATFTITVADGVKSDTVVFGDVGIVAAGETVKLPIIVTDLAGNEIKDPAVLANADKGVSISGAPTTPAPQFKKSGDGIVYEFKAPATAGPITLTALSKTGKVAIKTIDVRDEANPNVFTGLEKVNVLIFKGESVTLNYEKLIVEDQYGRTMTDSEFAADLAGAAPAAGDYRVVVSENKNSNIIALTGTAADGDDYVINKVANNSVTLTGNEKGTESISFKLQVRNNANTGWEDVSGSQLTVNFRTVELSELSSFGAEDIGKIYADVDADYDVTLEVFGQTSDGKKVTLPVNQYTAYSANGVVSVNATTKVVSATNVTFGQDEDEKEDKIVITITATGDTIEKAVIATDVKPTVSVLEVREDDVKVTALTLDVASAATFDINDIAGKLYVKDQYGKEAASISAAGITLKSGDTITPRLTISGLVNADGAAPVITNNGLSTAQITGLAKGDSFNLVISAGAATTEVIKVTIE